MCYRLSIRYDYGEARIRYYRWFTQLVGTKRDHQLKGNYPDGAIVFENIWPPPTAVPNPDYPCEQPGRFYLVYG
jgi:hypothetical protein